MSKRTPLEVFKFAVYLIMPVGTIAVFNEPEMIQRLINQRSYIIYPPEGERPPVGTAEDIKAYLDREKQRKQQEQQQQQQQEQQQQPARAKWFGIF